MSKSQNRGAMLVATLCAVAAPHSAFALDASDLGSVYNLTLTDSSGATVNPLFSWGAASGDLDGDGTTDLVYANGAYAPGTIIALNSGDGVAFDAEIVGARPACIGVGVGDLDGDGDLDIAAHCMDSYSDFAVELFLNDGAGNFAAGDVLSNTGGSWGDEATTTMVLEDLDGDGDLDIAHIGGSTVFFWFNDGLGDFNSASNYTISMAAHGIALGDITGDGHADLVVGGWTDGFRVVPGNGAGDFTATPVQYDYTDEVVRWVAPVLGDFDGDGDLDVMSGGTKGKAQLFLNDGTGALSNQGPYLDENSTLYLSLTNLVADLDNDGFDDLVGRYRIFGSDGDGTFTYVDAGNGSKYPLLMADLDGDGTLEIVYDGAARDTLAVADTGGGDPVGGPATGYVVTGTVSEVYAPPYTYGGTWPEGGVICEDVGFTLEITLDDNQTWPDAYLSGADYVRTASGGYTMSLIFDESCPYSAEGSNGYLNLSDGASGTGTMLSLTTGDHKSFFEVIDADSDIDLTDAAGGIYTGSLSRGTVIAGNGVRGFKQAYDASGVELNIDATSYGGSTFNGMTLKFDADLTATVEVLGASTDPDSDGDGYTDSVDAFPDDPNEWADSDADGTGDNSDAFPDDPDESVDSDGDGFGDNSDSCPGYDDLADADGDNVADGCDVCSGDDAWGDSDSDGVCDDTDVCSGDDATGDSDSDAVCDDLDVCSGDDDLGDTDSDGVCDDLDVCVGEDSVGNSDEDDYCDDNDAFPADGSEWADTDGDGVGDNGDLFPNDPNETGDSDSDGVGDNADPCTGTPNDDTDSDGVCDSSDVCPTDALDTDEDDDGICDVDDSCVGTDTADDDGDQVCNAEDLCLGNDALGDNDEDGLCEDSDNCPDDVNVDQADADADGIGDVCEADVDGDGTIDDDDNCVNQANSDQTDNDGDGLGDVCDEDDDGDGVSDETDNCPFYDNADQDDYDLDGLGDVCDGDDDADGVADEADSCPGTPLGAAFNELGCSGPQHAELICGEPTDYGQRRGRYISCVAKESRSAWRGGLITKRERAHLIRQAIYDVWVSYIRRLRRWC